MYVHGLFHTLVWSHATRRERFFFCAFRVSDVEIPHSVRMDVQAADMSVMYVYTSFSRFACLSTRSSGHEASAENYTCLRAR